MPKLTANTVLGLGCVAFALILVFVWIPLDTDTGLFERKRGRYIVGDGLAPTIAAVALLIAGAMLLIERAQDDVLLTKQNLKFIGAMIALGVVSTLLMRWVGPLATTLFAGGEDYRTLRDTVPWKYLGFLIGGTTLVFGMIAFVEGRASLRGLLIAVLATAAIILLYDLPFEDVLLPPNGDV